MKVLVLGSEGFIGNHLVTGLQAQQFEVHGLDRIAQRSGVQYHYHQADITPEKMGDLMKAVQPEICIHAAGSGSVPYSCQHPYQDFEANTTSTAVILDSIRIHYPQCRFLYFSSAAIYGNPEILPVKETVAASPISPYGFHKYMGELLCRAYFENFGVSSCVLRPFSVYGPGLRKQLLWDIYQKTLHTDSDNIILGGTGKETRDFVHVKDIVNAVVVIIRNNSFSGDIFNIGASQEVTIKHIAELLTAKLKNRKSVTFSNEFRTGDPRFWNADISRLQALGFKPDISLLDGIDNMANWLNTLD